MRNSNTPGPFEISWLFGKQPGDKPVPSDWSNYNWDVPAIVRGNEWIYPDFTGPGGVNMGGYGNPGDIPFADRGECSFCSTRRVVVRNVGVWRWFREGGDWMDYGDAAWHTPVLGDWDGDGHDTPGVYIRSTGQWHLNNDWDDNIPDIGLTYAGPANAIPVVGDWDGDGDDRRVGDPQLTIRCSARGRRHRAAGPETANLSGRGPRVLMGGRSRRPLWTASRRAVGSRWVRQFASCRRRRSARQSVRRAMRWAI